VVFGTVSSLMKLVGNALGPLTFGQSANPLVLQMGQFLIDKVASKYDQKPAVGAVVPVLEWMAQSHKDKIKSLQGTKKELTNAELSQASLSFIQRTFQLALMSWGKEDGTKTNMREVFMRKVLGFPTEKALENYSKLMQLLSATSDEESYEFVASFFGQLTKLSDAVAGLVYSSAQQKTDQGKLMDMMGLQKATEWGQTTALYKKLVDAPLVGGTIQDGFQTEAQQQTQAQKGVATNFAQMQATYNSLCPSSLAAGVSGTDACDVCGKCTTS